MSFFRNLFGSKNDDSSKEENASDSPFLPTQPNIPIDELFTIRFKNNGGKFLYCENSYELKENFLSILLENDWFECNVLCNEKDLTLLLDENKLTYDPTITDSKSEALSFVKRVYGTGFPSNITTVSSFKAKNDDNFMNLGGSVKNLYLLLLEDL